MDEEQQIEQPYQDQQQITQENIYQQQLRQQFNIWQFSSDELIYVEETLKGKNFDRETGRWVNVVGVEPVMNAKGITEFTNWLRIQLDKKNQLSNLNEMSEVNVFAYKLFESIVQIILINYWEWEIKEEKLEYIYSLVEFPIYAGVLKRAYKAGAMQSVSKTIHSIEQSITQQQNNNRQGRERGLNN